MEQRSIIYPAGPEYFEIPSRTCINPQAGHKDELRRHMTMRTYTMPLFLRDLYGDEAHRVVTPDNLAQHLECLRVGESKTLGRQLSEERIREMILEIHHSGEDLANVDEAVLEALGFMPVLAMAH